MPTTPGTDEKLATLSADFGEASANGIFAAIRAIEHAEADGHRRGFLSKFPEWARTALVEAHERGCSYHQLAQIFKANGVPVSDSCLRDNIRQWRKDRIAASKAKASSNGHGKMKQLQETTR